MMKVRAVVDAFGRMQSELAAEKRAMIKIWNSREKQITTIIENVTGFYGNKAAGTRVRKQMQDIKKAASAIRVKILEIRPTE
ncbi:MAG: DUF2130 domain-containing protein [Sedimentisphaerales bacterium]